MHRIGRTGRAGRSGTALLFVTPRERHLLNSIERVTRQKLVEVQLPSVDDVNAQRVEKFRDSITEALAAPGIDLFRKLIEGYERDHDVPMADIAAALALQSRDGGEFLMTEPPPEKRRERPDRPARDDGPPRKRREVRSDLATYRIAVGKRHKVMPGAIVGAIANEGGLHRSDFGHISIKPDHSLVELPAKLSQETLKKLEQHQDSGTADPPRTRSRAQGAPQVALRRPVHVTASKRPRRAGRPGVDHRGRTCRLAHRDPRRRGAAGGADPRRLHHRQVSAGLRRAGVLADGDRRADLLRAVGFPVVRAVGEGRRPTGRTSRRRCGATPGIGCAASCRPTSSPSSRPTCCTTSASAGPNPGHTWEGLVPQPHADPDLHRQLPVFVSAPRSYADVEPRGRGRVLRRASAAGLPAAGAAVPTAVAAAASCWPGWPGWRWCRRRG